MKELLAHISLSMALTLAAADVNAQAPSEGLPNITLETDPQQVRTGQEFELIWRVSTDNAQIFQVFVDRADSFGPEYMLSTWNQWICQMGC